MSRPLLTICKKSIQHFKNIAQKSNNSTIFIGVEGGGCNGLKYFIEPMEHKPDKTDEIMKIDEQLDVVICGKSLIHLIGTEINWEKNYMSEGISFSNPNATSSCGCGDTFSI